MKFEINRIEMLEAAKKAARVASTRVPVDVLNGILVESDSNTSEVILTATNFEVSIQLKIKGDIEKSGAMLVTPYLLVGMLSLLSGELVTFSAQKPDILRVESEKCVYEVNCLLANHYPKPTIPFPEETVKLSGICSLSNRTVFVVSKDDSKPALQCVKIKLLHNAVHAAACDGTRLMLVKNDSESPDNQEFLLPGHSLRMLASISNDKDVFDVSDIGNETVFMRENLLFKMRKITGDFLDTDTIIKSIKPAYIAITDASKMREALDLVILDTGREPVNIVLSDGHINLKRSNEYSEAQTSVSANISANTPDTGFFYNTNNLYKLFQVVDGKIRLELNSKGMMLIKSTSEVYLQLPLQPAIKSAANEDKHPKEAV